LKNRREALFTVLQLGFWLLLFRGAFWILSTGWLGY
jgi:hypothetical protein